MLQPLRPMPISPFFGYHTFSPSREEILQTLINGLSGRRLPKSQPVHNVHLDVMLTPADAKRGGSIALQIPISQVCTRCAGSGRAGLAECDQCDGHGMFWHIQQVDVILPTEMRDGTKIPVSLRPVGVTNMFISLHLRVVERV